MQNWLDPSLPWQFDASVELLHWAQVTVKNCAAEQAMAAQQPARTNATTSNDRFIDPPWVANFIDSSRVAQDVGAKYPIP